MNKISTAMKKTLLSGLAVISLVITCEKEKPESPVGLSSRIEITSGDATDISYYNAKISGKLGNTYGHTVKEYGHCWDTLQNPEISDNFVSLGSANAEKSYTSELAELKPGRKYYVRAYFTINEITKYSEPVSFSTFALGLPVVETATPSSVKATSVECGGTISKDGGSQVTAYGLCWNTIGNPKLSDNKSNNGNGLGSFTHILINLNKNTLYHIRAYATNDYGTSYGNEITITTSDGLPELTTTEVTQITASSAVAGGTVTDDEGIPVTARGVCWSTSAYPTISDNKTANGTGTGSFTSELAALTLNTAYYLRAYASNQTGTSYGNQVQFTTKDGLPVITTSDVTGVTTTSATSGGNVTDDGGYPVTSRGICWSTSPGPTIAGSKITNGSGTGTFSNELTDLQESTTYYLKAFATNQQGTVYGLEKSFTTQFTPGPHIEYSNFEVKKDNNNDNIINKGENIEMLVYLKNSGTIKAEQVRAIFSSSNPYITGLEPTNKIPFDNNNSYSLDYIDVGEKRFGSGNWNYYTIKYNVSTDIAENAWVTFDLDISDKDGHTWNDTLMVQVKPTNARIEFYKSEVDCDDNNDKIINAGEFINLNIYLKNTGTSRSNNVKATVSSLSPYVSNLAPTSKILFNDGGTSGYIDPGESRYSNDHSAYSNGCSSYRYTTISFNISPSTPLNSIITFDLNIEDESMNTWTDSFTITVK
jgi:hypothetical protein